MENLLLLILTAAADAQITVVGPSRCSGRVQVYYSGAWGTVCDDGWDMNDVAVVCRQVGCSPPFSAPTVALFGPGSGSIWLDDVSCSGSESSLDSCSHSPVGQHNCAHSEDAGVVCEALKVRLSGPTNCSGRVEVYYGGVWGTVCDEGFDMNDAAVVCRELGCEAAYGVRPQAYFGEGSGSIWLSNVGCSGSEKNLSDCSHGGFGATQCAHSNDVGVYCEVSVKKVLKVKVMKNSVVNLDEADVQADALEQLKQLLLNHGLNDNVKLRWRKQSNGNIFYKDKEPK